MDTNWGGARENAGRKRKSDEEKKQGYTFYLDQNDFSYIDDFEGKNRSERLRNLINEHKNLKKQMVFSS